MKYTIDEVTANAMSVVGTATAEDRNLFRNWAVLGLKQLGPNRNDVKIVQITPNSNGLIKKPDDFTHGIDLALFTTADHELQYQFNHGAARIHNDRFSLQDEEMQDAITGRVDVSEDAYYYQLGNNSSVVGYAIIRYFAYPIDSEGIPLFDEEDLEAIVAYCRYNWSLRKNDNRSEIEQNRQIWLEERDRRKGAKKMPDSLAMRGIASRWMSLIPISNEGNY